MRMNIIDKMSGAKTAWCYWSTVYRVQSKRYQHYNGCCQ